MNDLWTNLIAEGIGVFIAVLIAYGLDKWGEYKRFKRARIQLHKWSRIRRNNMWKLINECAESSQESWRKHLRVRRDVATAESSIFYAVDSFRVNHGDYIDIAVQEELEQEQMFWLQASALFCFDSMTFFEMRRRGALLNDHIETHMEWTGKLLSVSEKLDELTCKLVGKLNSSGSASEREAPSLESIRKFFAATIPYVLESRSA
jgi:hypothetical protein